MELVLGKQKQRRGGVFFLQKEISACVYYMGKLFLQKHQLVRKGPRFSLLNVCSYSFPDHRVGQVLENYDARIHDPCPLASARKMIEGFALMFFMFCEQILFGGPVSDRSM